MMMMLMMMMVMMMMILMIMMMMLMMMIKMMMMVMMMMRRPSSLRVRAKPRHLPYIYICITKSYHITHISTRILVCASQYSWTTSHHIPLIQCDLSLGDTLVLTPPLFRPLTAGKSWKILAKLLGDLLHLGRIWCIACIEVVFPGWLLQ